MRSNRESYNDNSLCMELMGIQFRNPIMLASGFLGISLDVFDRLYRAGVGGIVTKSISGNSIEGYRNPTIVSISEGTYVNAVGLSNPGAKAFSQEISYNKDLPIFVSLVGSSDKDFPYLIKHFDNLNILGYEINLSCPHVSKMGMDVGDDPEMVSRIIKVIKSETKKPITIKVGIGNADVVKIAQVANESGADAITAINTVRAMVIDIENRIPVLSNKIGGLSGKSIKPIAVRSVYEISKSVDIPVIGCGGIFCWEDAIEFMLAGASAVQLGSVIAYEGISIFSTIISGMKQYLERKNLTLQEVTGLAHKS